MTMAFDGLHAAFAKGFMTTTSGDGAPRIQISFRTLAEMRAAHAALVAALLRPASSGTGAADRFAADDYDLEAETDRPAAPAAAVAEAERKMGRWAIKMFDPATAPAEAISLKLLMSDYCNRYLETRALAADAQKGE